MSKTEEISNKNSIAQTPSQLTNISGDNEKMVPKFCTTIGISLLKNKNMVLTMVYHEPPNNVGNIIDRIMVDLDHAKSINKALTKILEDIENGTAKFE